MEEKKRETETDEEDHLLTKGPLIKVGDKIVGDKIEVKVGDKIEVKEVLLINHLLRNPFISLVVLHFFNHQNQPFSSIKACAVHNIARSK